MKNGVKISAIIPIRSEDIKLAQKAINSIIWVNDILIADSSTTAAGMKQVKNFAQKNGAKYIYREYKYSADFKNWAIPQAKNEWILLLDADEIVTAKLKRYIQKFLTSSKIDKFDGFGIARKHFFFGKFLRYGGRYPLYNVRLFRKKCRYEDRDVHAHIILEKSRLKNILPKNGDILHFSDRNLNQFFERLNRYGNYQADYIKKIAQQRKDIKWKQFFTNAIYFKAVIKDIWFFIPGTPFLRFLWMYVIKLGFLDGKHGLIISMFYGFQDYVSKTKYYSLINKETIWRLKLQNIFIHILALIFGKKKRLVAEYKKHLNTGNTSLRSRIKNMQKKANLNF